MSLWDFPYGRIVPRPLAANMCSEKSAADWELDLETVLVKRNLDDATKGSHEPRPLVTPIYTSSTYLLESAKEGEMLSMNHAKDGYLYSRWGNPTADSASCVLARLEGAAGSLLFSSGCAAITTTLFSFLKAGDHMVINQPVYGGVNAAVRTILGKLDIEVTWLKESSMDNYRNAVKENTKVLYAEVIVNPTMSLLDVEAFGALGRSLPGLVTMVDATFASPYLMQPVRYGVDLVLHSCTKYIGGHSDLVGGALSYAKKEHEHIILEHQILLGTNLSPFDAYLIRRSLNTLALRMDRHCQNAMKVAQYLESHPKVLRVLYLGLPSHPDHELAKRLLKKGCSGMLSFEIQGSLEDGIKVVENLKVIVHAVSLGGVESLICHPASTTHCDAYVTPEDKKTAGITDSLLRLSVGIESADDIIKDLEQALAMV